LHGGISPLRERRLAREGTFYPIMTTSTESRVFDLSLLRCAAGTDVGMRRDENQDAFGVVRHETFQGFFVADGMGGVKGGAIASRLAVSTLQESLPALGSGLSPEQISRVVASINSQIFEQGAAQPGLAGMGTTLVGLVFTPSGLISVNVGDSRAYRIRGSEITQISEDHTLVRELVRSGAISPKDASNHPVSHMLTRSLGPLQEVVIECRTETEGAQEGDIYVLCSDGLYNFVNDAEILEVIRQNPLDDANQILINLANRRGGTDNITVIVISVGETGGRRRGSDYRNARQADAGEAKSEEYSFGAQERVPVPEGFPVVTAPRVEEPKDYHAERESLKARKQKAHHQAQGIPAVLMVSGAILFGLVVGDVARRWGAFPDFVALIEPGNHGAGGSGRSPTNLDELSRELAVSRSQGRDRERLPDIARRISGSQETSPSSRVRGSRRDLLALNRTALGSAATKIEDQLKAIAQPASQHSEESLRQAERKLTEISADLKEIETQIDTASRRLSLWFGRKKNVEEGDQDLFEAGGDVERVGAVSERVKKKAAEWTEATYALQAKQDEFELQPGDENLRREVDQLRADRQAVQQELRDEVVRAIDGVLADTYRQLEELKVRRDIVAGQLSTAQDEVAFLHTLLNPDTGARETLRKRLERELVELREAIKEIKGDG
jgi:serine/threonine protein phosphatase PrpC